MPMGPGTKLPPRAARGRSNAARAGELFELNASLPDGSSIPVLVTHKRVKNLNLRVRSNGSVVLSMPARCPACTAEEFLVRKATWIAEHVRAQRLRTGQLDHIGTQGVGARGLEAPPQSIPLWGEAVDTAAALGLAEDSLAQLSPAELQSLILALYKREVARALPAIAERYENIMGVHATRWSIRTMKTRWGSCTPKTGAIRINTRLAAHPPACLDFVVAHELTHLLEPSHNARFHTLLDQFCPGNRRAAALLRKQPEQKEAQAR